MSRRLSRVYSPSAIRAAPEVAPGTPKPWARFMVETLRPSFFPEEATREIEPFVKAEIAKWADVVQRAGVTVQ